jgi:hypothetical protein
VKLQPAALDSPIQTGLVFGWRGFLAEQKGPVDQLDVDPAVLCGLGGVCDLNDLAGGFSRSEYGRSARNFLCNPYPFGFNKLLGVGACLNSNIRLRCNYIALPSRRATANLSRAPDQPTGERSQRPGLLPINRAFVLFENIICGS